MAPKEGWIQASDKARMAAAANGLGLMERLPELSV
jgi:hypothetical protein